MKIIDIILTKKNSNSKTQIISKKHSNSPKGITLRSRKVLFADQDSPHQKENQQVKSNEHLAQSNQKTIRKQILHDEEQKSKPTLFQNVLKTKKKQTQKVQVHYAYQDEDSDVEQLPEQMFVTPPVKRKRRQSRPFPMRTIFECEQFKTVEMLAKGKMFSTLLLNECGQVIFADRLGSEHFEGSLNNFSRNPIYSMILTCELEKFFNNIRLIKANTATVLKLLIYSKNSKRRYSKSSNEILLTNQDIFHRYLKCLSCQIIPIKLSISSTEDYEGFWNKNLINQNQPTNCYLFKSRLSKKLPDLSEYNFKEDKKIQKFLKYTRKKQYEQNLKLDHKSEHKVDQYSEKKSSQVFQNEKHSNSQFLSNKEIENIYFEMNEDNKHSKSVLTRGGILNSGQGKSRREAQLM